MKQIRADLLRVKINNQCPHLHEAELGDDFSNRFLSLLLACHNHALPLFKVTHTQYTLTLKRLFVLDTHMQH